MTERKKKNTVTALLVCSEERKPTWHHFKGYNKRVGRIDLVYSCTGCGQERVWGTRTTVRQESCPKIYIPTTWECLNA